MDGKGRVSVIREHLHLLLIIIFSHLANTVCETFFFRSFFLHKSFLVLLLCTLVFICHCMRVFSHHTMYQGARPNTTHIISYIQFSISDFYQHGICGGGGGGG